MTEPVRMRTLQGSGTRRAVDASIQAEPPGKLVTGADEDCILICGVHSPEDDVVNQLWSADPPFQEDDDAMRENVIARVNGMLVTQVIDECLIRRHLIEITQQAVAADRKLPKVSPADEKTFAGIEFAPRFDARCRLVLRLLLGCRRSRRSYGRLTDHELATASVRHPDAGIVVAPRLPEYAASGTGRL